MKLAANLSWLFKEEACLLKRIALAEKAGFKSIELAWPYQYTVSEFKAAVDASSVEVVLINTAPGDKEGDMGLAAVPGREEDFITGLKQAIEYAKAASCGNIHIMAGNVASGADRTHYRSTMVQNLCKAVVLLEEAGLMGNLEPINTHISAPNYFLNLPQEALSIIDEVENLTGKQRLVYQCDFFHLQVQHGNITRFLENNISKIGHIQIAQVPGRNEPDTDGELNYSFLFQSLQRLGYKGYIGLEYAPIGVTTDGLKWMNNFAQ